MAISHIVSVMAAGPVTLCICSLDAGKRFSLAQRRTQLLWLLVVCNGDYNRWGDPRLLLYSNKDSLRLTPVLTVAVPDYVGIFLHENGNWFIEQEDGKTDF